MAGTGSASAKPSSRSSWLSRCSEAGLSGVYAAFAEVGHTPTTMTVTLGLAPGMPVPVVQRVTRDQEDRPIELVHVVSTADRAGFVYDDLPIIPHCATDH